MVFVKEVIKIGWKSYYLNAVFKTYDDTKEKKKTINFMLPFNEKLLDTFCVRQNYFKGISV